MVCACLPGCHTSLLTTEIKNVDRQYYDEDIPCGRLVELCSSAMYSANVYRSGHQVAWLRSYTVG